MCRYFTIVFVENLVLQAGPEILGDRSDLQLDDGMHPNPKGIAVMVERMTPAVRDFVKAIRDTPK